ncbi:hypothetical protein AB1N83_003544 [Pleurotus pulmonarius]
MFGTQPLAGHIRASALGPKDGPKAKCLCVLRSIHAQPISDVSLQSRSSADLPIDVSFRALFSNVRVPLRT